jgi:hypothetical protein
MKIVKTFASVLLIGISVATPVLAAPGEACIQHNRLMNWEGKDKTSLLMTDLDRHQYLVHVTEGCVGLTDATARLIFRNWQDLACLDPGDIITVTSIGTGARQCSVEHVEAVSAPPHG